MNRYSNQDLFRKTKTKGKNLIDRKLWKDSRQRRHSEYVSFDTIER